MMSEVDLLHACALPLRKGKNGPAHRTPRNLHHNAWRGPPSSCLAARDLRLKLRVSSVVPTADDANAAMCNAKKVRSTYICRLHAWAFLSSQCSDTVVGICLFVSLKEIDQNASSLLQLSFFFLEKLRCNSPILQIHS